MTKIISNGMVVPDYIDEELFKKAIENECGQNSVEIDSVVITNGSGGGENYCSDILRCSVKFNLNNNVGDKSLEKSLIVKSMKMQENTEIPTMETHLYGVVVPEMEKIFERQGINVSFSPKVFHSIDKPVVTMVMNDLSTDNFILEDRIKGLDEDHIRVLLKKIAQFHASSMIVNKEKPELIESLQLSIFEKEKGDEKVFDDVICGNIPHIANIFKDKIGYEKIAEKLGTVFDKFTDKMIEVCKNSTKDCVKVINHGDLWVNNFLYKHDSEGKPVDVSLIDLQIAYYAGLGIDINYFFNTSIPLDLLATKRYDFLRFYYKHLKESLELLHHDDIPTWEDVREEVRNKELYGFWTMEAILPIIALNKDTAKDSSIEKFADAEAFNNQRKIMLSEKRVYETMKYSLVRFDELGILD
ncbi:hypothetical protein ACFFRR_002944 [Megaselia abdita]